jgi:hypothetical protein
MRMSLLLVVAILMNRAASAFGASAADLLARSEAAYHALHSYSDKGDVLSEYRNPGTNVTATTKDSFVTAFQSPHGYVFQFTKEGGERYVIWTVDATTHDWWSATHVHTVHNVGPSIAFLLGVTPTRGSSMMLPPLLFPRARLHGPLTDIQEPQMAQDESINGHVCFRITGKELMGNSKSPRPIIIWIDHDTLLVRRVVEDTPESSTDSIERITTTIDPVPNPTLPEGSLIFEPPK